MRTRSPARGCRRRSRSVCRRARVRRGGNRGASGHAADVVAAARRADGDDRDARRARAERGRVLERVVRPRERERVLVAVARGRGRVAGALDEHVARVVVGAVAVPVDRELVDRGRERVRERAEVDAARHLLVAARGRELEREVAEPGQRAHGRVGDDEHRRLGDGRVAEPGAAHRDASRTTYTVAFLDAPDAAARKRLSSSTQRPSFAASPTVYVRLGFLSPSIMSLSPTKSSPSK